MMKRKQPSGLKKLLVFWLAFIIALCYPFAYKTEIIYAATAPAADLSQNELRGMLSVATVVPAGWQNNKTLVSELLLRDTKAAAYADAHHITGANDISVSLEDSGSKIQGAEWVSNVLYRGDILRSDTFDGFVAKYNGGADFAVIHSGLNEIDVELIPVTNKALTDNGRRRDLSSWDEEDGFASRINHSETGRKHTLYLDPAHTYRTKLFIVGLASGVLSKGSIYQPGRLLDYNAYLSSIGASPSDENYAAYLAYVSIYLEMFDSAGISEIPAEDARDLFFDSSDERSLDRPVQDAVPPTPEEEQQGRIIMIYLDGADLGFAAVMNLRAMLEESMGKSIGDDNHILIFTGGSESAWADDTFDIGDFLYDEDGNPAPDLADSLGMINQLWELDHGTMFLIGEYPDGEQEAGGFMTDPATLGSFLEASREIYPDGRYYDLILWDHGGGPEGGFGADQRNDQDSPMTLYDMTDAIRESGIGFDLIAFDACLMSNAEVSMALAPYTDYLMASELLLPGAGYRGGYTKLIEELHRNNTIGTVAYANSILNACIDSYGAPAANDATLALIDAGKVRGDLAEALQGFADELIKIVQNNDETSLDEIMRIRKMFTYMEIQNGNAYSRDLIDIQDFMGQLSVNPVLEESAPAFIAACNRLISAESATKLNYRFSAYDPESLSTSQGSFPHGLSIYFPTIARNVYSMIPGDDHYVDQVSNLVQAYTASEDLASYGKALASYAIWLKVGKILGYESSWKGRPLSENDTQLAEEIFEDTGEDSIQELINASDLNDDQVIALINAQVEDRIRRDAIEVIPPDPGPEDVKYLTIGNTDPELVSGVEVQLYVAGLENDELVSLGCNTVDYAPLRNPHDRSVTYTLAKYDNRWLTIDGKVVSFYDSEIRELEDHSKYRIGIVPVAYWTKAREGETLLRDAIESRILQVGVLEVGFSWDDVNDRFSDTGEILYFRPDADNSLAGSGRELQENEIYELLAGFDEGNDLSKLRSIGMIHKTAGTMETAEFKEITMDADDDKICKSTYNLVDGYGNKYALNEKNFPGEGEDPDPVVPDPRNLDDFHEDYASPDDDYVIVVPQASIYTAEWGPGESGAYDDRTVKTTENGAQGETDTQEPAAADMTEPASSVDPEGSAEPEAAADPETLSEPESTAPSDVVPETGDDRDPEESLETYPEVPAVPEAIADPGAPAQPEEVLKPEDPEDPAEPEEPEEEDEQQDEQQDFSAEETARPENPSDQAQALPESE